MIAEFTLITPAPTNEEVCAVLVESYNPPLIFNTAPASAPIAASQTRVSTPVTVFTPETLSN